MDLAEDQTDNKQARHQDCSHSTSTAFDIEQGSQTSSSIEENSEDGCRSHTPLIQRVLHSKRYENFEKLTISVYIVLFFVVLFVDQEVMAGLALGNSVGTMVFDLLVIPPHIFFFIPLNISFLAAFPQTVRFQLYRWKSFGAELWLMACAIGVTVVGIILAFRGQSEEQLLKSTAAALVVLQHVLAFYLLDQKRQLILLPNYCGKGLVRRQDLKRAIRTSTLAADEMLNLDFELDAATYFIPKTSIKQFLTGKLWQKANITVQDLQKHRKKRELSELVKEQLHGDQEKNWEHRSWSLARQLFGQFPWLSTVFLATAFLSNIAISLQPISIGFVVSTVSSFDASEDSDQGIWTAAFILLANILVVPIFDSLALYSVGKLGSGVENFLKASFFQQICTSNSTVQGLSAGDLSSRFSSDVEKIKVFITKSLYWDGISGCVRYIGSIIILGSFDLKMALYFAICLPVLIAQQSKTSPGQKNGNPSAHIQERFQTLVKLRRNLELYKSRDFVWSKTRDAIAGDLMSLERATVQGNMFVASIGAWAGFITGMLILAFTVTVVDEAKRGGDAVQIATVGLAIITRIYSPIAALTRAGERWLDAAAAFHRISEIVSVDSVESSLMPKVDKHDDASTVAREPTKENDDEAGFKPMQNSLELKDVHFSYPDAKEETLKGVDASFEAGKYVCIVGGSGAGESLLSSLICQYSSSNSHKFKSPLLTGKSTLLNILTREVIETKGRVLVDGQQSTSSDALRAQMSVVLQESAFFQGTVRDNIRMGKPEATEDEILRAVSRAQVSQFLDQLPDGLDTILDGDAKISGGQAQRISLARALVRSPRILVLDEATSALDRVTEQGVIETINSLSREDNVAVISVTHRLHTTDTSDEIIVLKDGVVAERGSPNDLNMDGTLFSNIRKGLSL